MKKFKVRITKSPEQMKYGGQSSYGLNLGHRNVYSDMPDNPHEKLSKSLQPVPRNQAKIEAEKGETAYGDFDGDGLLEHKVIGGKPHSQGGTPLDVPEGTFIYSNTKKMRIGGPVLQNFGKSATDKKKYTPAELAKQYDINKYKGILTDPNTDHLSKETAKLMMANYQKKLAELAMLQESKKGFPQGIPQVAAPLMAKMQQQNPNQQPEEEQQEGQAMYGGGMAYGGVSGQNPYPGTYADGYSGTYSGGNYFPHGGTFIPDPMMMPGDLPQYGYGKAMYGMANGGSYAQGGSSTQQKILETITQLLQKGSDPETVLQQLVEAKIPQQQATKLIEYAMQQLQGGQNAAPQQQDMGVPSQGGYAYGGYYAEGGEDYLEEDPSATDAAGPGDGIQKVKKSEIGKYERDGFVRIPGSNVWRKGTKTIQAVAPTIVRGTPGQAAVIKKGTPGKKYVPNENAWWNGLSPAEKAAHNAKIHKMVETDPQYTGTPDEVVTPEVAATPDQKVCEPGYVFNPATGNCEKPNETEEKITYEEDGSTKKKKYPPVNNIGTMAPWNMAAAMAVPPKKYFPYYSNIHANIPNPTFYDPERELAAGEEQAMALQQGTAFLDPQAYSARASAIQGNAATNAANVLGKYNNLNVGVANQFSPLQTDILNKVMEYQAGRADKTYMGNVVTNQQYDNSMRAYLNNIAKVKTKDFDNTSKMNMLNATNPYYSIDKRGRFQFKPGVDAMSVITGSNALSPDNDQYADYIKEANRLKGMGLDPRTINAALKVKYPGLTSGSGTSTKKISNINNQYLQAMSGTQSAYPYNMDQYDMTDLYE